MSWPRPPAPILQAAQIGEGFEFVSLNDAVALARGPDHWTGVYIDVQRPAVSTFDLSFPAGIEPDAVRDIWRGDLPIEGSQVLVLACVERNCSLFSAAELDDYGVPRNGFLEPWEPLNPEWDARGIVQLRTYDPGAYSICVFGRGIACRTGAGAWDVIRAPELGLIREASSHLALTEAGSLLAARVDDEGVVRVPVEWREVTGSEPLVRLTSAGAFGSGGSWVRESGGLLSSCVQRPALAAGTPPFDALDANGTAHARQWVPRDSEYQPCKWRVKIEVPVLGEADLDCGIARNWIVLTRERLIAMQGGPFCAID